MGMAHAVLKLSPRMTVDKVSRRLMGAGVGRAFSPTSFLASKAFLGVGGFVGGMFLGGVTGKGALGILLSLLFALIGFVLPDIFISFKARSRREEIRSELPDALDLLAVSVEAGLGFDAAIVKLTEHMEGPLIEEFALALGEMSATRHPSSRRSSAPSSRPISSVSRSGGSFACRRPIRATSVRLLPRRRP